jgi:hypothetical protein
VQATAGVFFAHRRGPSASPDEASGRGRR